MMRWLVAALCALAGSVCAGERAFVTTQNDDAVSVVALPEMRVGATLAVGGKPAGVAVSPDGKRAYVTSPEGKYLSVLNADPPIGAQAHSARRRSAGGCGRARPAARVCRRLVRAPRVRRGCRSGRDRQRVAHRPFAIRARGVAGRHAAGVGGPRQQPTHGVLDRRRARAADRRHRRATLLGW